MVAFANTDLKGIITNGRELRQSGIVETDEYGLVVLSPVDGGHRRRILFVNSYGGRSCWQQIKSGVLAPHHLWGCQELVRLGYEVALAEPLPHFYLYRRPIPHDLRLLKAAKEWLGRDGIIFSAHTLLYWLPLLKSFGGLKSHIVSLTYAREELDFARLHSGIVGLTPAATEHARKLAPGVKTAYVGWGVDLGFYPKLQYAPEWMLSCGIANRDFNTLRRAAALTQESIRVVCPGLQPGLPWSSNVTLVDGGQGWASSGNKTVNVQNLLDDYYPRSSASLIIMKGDPEEYTANGFTNLMEALAVGRPVIVTRTGALAGELDVEKAGCGLHVPADDPQALANAINELAGNPARAEKMGEIGRQLAETRYNIGQYAAGLHNFFESL